MKLVLWGIIFWGASAAGSVISVTEIVQTNPRSVKLTFSKGSETLNYEYRTPILNRKLYENSDHVYSWGKLKSCLLPSQRNQLPREIQSFEDEFQVYRLIRKIAKKSAQHAARLRGAEAREFFRSCDLAKQFAIHFQTVPRHFEKTGFQKTLIRIFRWFTPQEKPIRSNHVVATMGIRG